MLYLINSLKKVYTKFCFLLKQNPDIDILYRVHTNLLKIKIIKNSTDDFGQQLLFVIPPFINIIFIFNNVIKKNIPIFILSKLNSLKRLVKLKLLTTYNLLIQQIEGLINCFSNIIQIIDAKLSYHFEYSDLFNQNLIKLFLGYTHPIIISIPKNINVELENSTTLLVKSIDKDKLNNFCKYICRLRPIIYIKRGIYMNNNLPLIKSVSDRRKKLK